jgi:hypothetical protein
MIGIEISMIALLCEAASPLLEGAFISKIAFQAHNATKTKPPDERLMIDPERRR